MRIEPSPALDAHPGPDWSTFSEHFDKAEKNSHAVAFPNVSNDTMLIVPTPDGYRDFTTLQDFQHNATVTKRKAFWSMVVDAITVYSSMHDKCYVSTHGVGVPWLHVRVSATRKYFPSDFATHK
jgi:hypothetical protein